MNDGTNKHAAGTGALGGNRTTATWLSQLAGRPVEPPRRMVVQDLVDSRPFFESLTDLTDLAEVAQFVPDVILRQRDGVELTAEIVVPHGDGPFPMLLHLHGGGFCTGSTAADRKLSHLIAAKAGVVVVNLGYGLAPEHPFPWAIEDTVYALRWMAVNGHRYNGIPDRIVVEGCSAGAGLAAGAALVLAGDDEGIDHGDLAHVVVDLHALMLIYGLFDFPLLLTDTGSNVGSAELWALAYIGNQFTRRLHDPRVSPVESTRLAALPRTYITCGSDDSLLGHSLGMIAALTKVGVPVQASIVESADHGFIKRPSAAGTAEIARAIGWLQQVTQSRSEQTDNHTHEQTER